MAMSEKNNENDNTAKYSIFNNIIFIFKEEIQDSPKTIWLLPINIISEFLVPFIGTVIPALALSLITGNNGAGYFALEIGAVLILYTIINGVQKYSSTLMDYQHVFTRCYNFTKKLIWKSINTDYNNIEPLKQQRLMEKASEAINTNWVGIELMYKRTPTAIINLLGMLSYGTAIMVLDLRILVILIFMSIFNLKLNEYARNYMIKRREEETFLNRTINYLYDKSVSLENGKDVRIYYMEKWFRKIFQNTIEKLVKLRASIEMRRYLPVASDTIFSALRDSAAYIILITQILHNKISISEFTLYIGLIYGFSNWLFGFVNAYSEIKKASVQVNDFRYMLEFPDKFKRKGGINIPSKEQYPLTIEFKDVSFRYEGADKDTLSHINLTIKAGERLALVGHNGAGKSTIVKLLCGFYHPTSGEIFVGGHPISEYNVDEYYKLIVAVFQDINPLSFTIAENISGKTIEETYMPKVREALKAAGLYEKVESLKDKEMSYITQVFSKNGLQLSGGETQKLMLARAIYKDAPIMILDEPTAALDPIAESRMYEEYNSLTSNKTSIFISHRLASTRFCDKIVFLENGRILEIGTHDELIKMSGKYTEVYEVQSHYYKDANIEDGNYYAV
ncbi:ABC transporter ATP-binding protein [Clostridium sp. 19966]|uniref:ABC transporter ATP-binding protein n=1 Tax=Clostridium sp. 19966 TaxID=2768166 RepID=UPI0028E003B3|nr:ABC transporter ATP-binding protein [Clostridium sp. 19966]MDT8715357.1 ABC transporter ATP-binding protein [Clostridium sp. 19966]